MDVLGRYEPLVDDFAAFRTACDRPLPHVVRVNTLKADRSAVERALETEGVDWRPVTWSDTLLELDTDSPGLTWPYFLGWIHGQEAASALPVDCLDPAPGSVVWDACAAPGSKASQIAQVMNDDGRLVANDDDLGRLAPLRTNLDRLGVTCAATTNQDARQFSLKPFGFEAFDAALVDAPCSGEGTIRKNPAAVDNWSESFLESISAVQTDILRRAIQATRSGGHVVYSTCTFAPEENEAVLDRVLDTEACRVIEIDCPVATAPGVTEWQGTRFDPSVELARRVWPHLNDTGGFFLAKIEVGG